MRCDNACPADVPLSQMHNEARAEYVEDHMSKFSMKYIRNRLVANYRTVAKFSSMFPRTTNLFINNSVLRWFGEKVMGITKERELPTFATTTFREWWAKRGGPNVESDEKKVAYFHGCYANYNKPHVAKAMVRVYEQFGYEVAVPDQGCSGTPMFANGMLSDAASDAKLNVKEMGELVEEGYDVICSCTSCSMSLKQEYPELFNYDGIEDVSSATYESLEYLRIHEDLSGEISEAEVEFPDVAYHAPCHARNQGLDRQAVELFRDLDGMGIEDVGKSCSGISGTYGLKSEKYEKSMAIGEEMFEHMEHAEGETGMTECPTCSMQMEHGTGYEIRHPLEVLEEALVSA